MLALAVAAASVICISRRYQPRHAYATIAPARPTATELSELRVLVRSLEQTDENRRDIVVVVSSTSAAPTRATLAGLGRRVVVAEVSGASDDRSATILDIWDVGVRLGYARLVYLAPGSIALRDMSSLFACGPQLCATAHAPFARASDVLVVSPADAASRRSVSALLAAHASDPARFAAALAAAVDAAPLFGGGASAAAAIAAGVDTGMRRLGAQHSIDSMFFYEHGHWDRYRACGTGEGTAQQRSASRDGAAIPSLSLSYNGGVTAGGALRPLLGLLLHPAQWYGYPLFELHSVYAAHDDRDRPLSLLRSVAMSAPPRGSAVVVALACVAALAAAVAACAPCAAPRGVAAMLGANLVVAAAIPATASPETAWIAMVLAPNIALLGLAALLLRRRARAAARALAAIAAWQLLVLWTAWPATAGASLSSADAGVQRSKSALAKPGAFIAGLFVAFAAQARVVCVGGQQAARLV